MQIVEGSFRDERGEELLERPDGRNAITFGWLLVGLSILGAWVAGSTDIVDYSGNTDFGALRRQSLFFWSACGAGSLAIVFLIVGYITRALYFVSGDAMKPSNATMIVREKTALRAQFEKPTED